MCGPYRKFYIEAESIVTDMSKEDYDSRYCGSCGSELKEANGAYYCPFCNA